MGFVCGVDLLLMTGVGSVRMGGMRTGSSGECPGGDETWGRRVVEVLPDRVSLDQES